MRLRAARWGAIWTSIHKKHKKKRKTSKRHPSSGQGINKFYASSTSLNRQGFLHVFLMRRAMRGNGGLPSCHRQFVRMSKLCLERQLLCFIFGLVYRHGFLACVFRWNGAMCGHGGPPVCKQPQPRAAKGGAIWTSIHFKKAYIKTAPWALGRKSTTFMFHFLACIVRWNGAVCGNGGTPVC